VLNIAVFASGRGSNTRAILENIDRGKIHARVNCIVSNKKDAGIFAIADEWNIARWHLDPSAFDTEEKYADALVSVLKECQTNLIVLAGYLKKIPAAVISQYRNRLMNIHPALLPAFGGTGMYGMRVHQAVVDSGVKVTGVTVHFVDEEYDRGPIILQEPVRVEDDDTPESLSQRVLQIEHELYSRAIALFAEGRVEVRNRRVYIN
jgi:phosphoribosylglycinamide formyltransferase 1